MRKEVAIVVVRFEWWEVGGKRDGGRRGVDVGRGLEGVWK